MKTAESPTEHTLALTLALPRPGVQGCRVHMAALPMAAVPGGTGQVATRQHQPARGTTATPQPTRTRSHGPPATEAAWGPETPARTWPCASPTQRPAGLAQVRSLPSSPDTSTTAPPGPSSEGLRAPPALSPRGASVAKGHAHQGLEPRLGEASLLPSASACTHVPWLWQLPQISHSRETHPRCPALAWPTQTTHSDPLPWSAHE